MMMMSSPLFEAAGLAPPVNFPSLEAAEAVCRICTACALHEGRTHTVFSDGPPTARIMIIGEAPGADEDAQGIPFVGRSGQLLTKILAAVGFERGRDVYICNTVKCRPPGNRVPTKVEKATCRHFLEAQLSYVKPDIILLTGATALSSLMPEEKRPISKLRGQWLEGPHGERMMPVFHPSYLLRNPSSEEGSPKWLMWQDMKEVRRVWEDLCAAVPVSSSH
jgi:uracil-DNA glycosylase